MWAYSGQMLKAPSPMTQSLSLSSHVDKSEPWFLLGHRQKCGLTTLRAAPTYDQVPPLYMGERSVGAWTSQPWYV